MLTFHDFSRVSLTNEVIETPHTQKDDVGRHTRPHSAATPSSRDSRKQRSSCVRGGRTGGDQWYL